MLAENQAKRLELLLEIAPNTKRVFLPYDPQDAASVSAVSQIRGVALNLGLELVERTISSDDEVALAQEFPETVNSIFLSQAQR